MRKFAVSFLFASCIAILVSGCGGSEPAPAPAAGSAPAEKAEAKPAPSAGKSAGKKSPGVEPESNTPARRRDKE